MGTKKLWSTSNKTSTIGISLNIWNQTWRWLYTSYQWHNIHNHSDANDEWKTGGRVKRYWNKLLNWKLRQRFFMKQSKWLKYMEGQSKMNDNEALILKHSI